MKTFRFLILLLFVLAFSFQENFAQQNGETFKGYWYSSSINKNDKVLNFTRQNNDSVYLQWNFLGKDSLRISKCEIKDYYKKEQTHLVIASGGGIDKWSVDESNSILSVKLLKGIQTYGILTANANNLRLEKKEFTSTKKRDVFYFLDNDVDKAVSKKDTLVFSSTRVNRSFPRIELRKTNQFIIHHDIKLDTITKKMPDGVYMEQMVENSKKIHGIWKSRYAVKRIQLEFGKDVCNDYDIKEVGERIYFIKR
ncbi:MULTISPECIES: hypothetical protein [unclassified Saccharicrinis]|uniref:hypothetical protein n=1 Tax=unclassified Saccharicrinis TaxID=2646859 RepID=UPI003D351BF0